MHPNALQASCAGIRRHVRTPSAAGSTTLEGHHAVYQASLAAVADLDSHSMAASTLQKQEAMLRDCLAFLDLATTGSNKRVVFNCIL